MKTYLPLLLLSALLCSRMYAQEDYLKWSEQDKSKQQKFYEEQENQFLDFIQKGWKEYKILLDEKENLSQSPQELPKFDNQLSSSYVFKIYSDSTKRNSVAVFDADEQHNEILTKKTNNNVIPGHELSGNFIDAKYKTDTLNYFGINTAFSHHDLSSIILKSIQPNDLADYWKEVRRYNFIKIILECAKFKKTYSLNDWGYLLFVKEFAAKVYPTRKNEKYLLTWFLLCKSGYKAKIGAAGENIYLVLSTRNTLKDYPYLFILNGDEKEYIINFETEPLSQTDNFFTFEKDYPGAEMLFDFNITSTPNLPKKNISRKFIINLEKDSSMVNLVSNESIINYYRDYPRVEYDVYFNATVDDSIQRCILNQFTPFLRGLSQVKALNILLNFVQTKFNDRSDPMLFRKNKMLFVEETLFYNNSTSEDRAIFFAFLVKKLLNLKVVGINYKGHLAAAVEIKGNVKGDKVKMDGSQYIICDPSYVGAPAGYSLPAYPPDKILNTIAVNRN